MVKRVAEYTQFNIYSTILTTSLFNTVPQYVIILLFILAFIAVIGLLGIIIYYVYRKFNSIDKYIDKDKQDNENSNTYKELKKKYKKDVSELEAKTMPDGQTVITMAEWIRGLKNKK
ncbi:MAG: hypothetical protein HDQ99_08300 [Lachnospiraceae bacterium]|nr:hypothetical protein [Lachnospiraceae bacterium]